MLPIPAPREKGFFIVMVFPVLHRCALVSSGSIVSNITQSNGYYSLKVIALLRFSDCKLRTIASADTSMIFSP